MNIQDQGHFLSVKSIISDFDGKIQNVVIAKDQNTIVTFSLLIKTIKYVNSQLNIYQFQKDQYKRIFHRVIDLDKVEVDFSQNSKYCYLRSFNYDKKKPIQFQLYSFLENKIQQQEIDREILKIIKRVEYKNFNEDSIKNLCQKSINLYNYILSKSRNNQFEQFIQYISFYQFNKVVIIYYIVYGFIYRNYINQQLFNLIINQQQQNQQHNEQENQEENQQIQFQLNNFSYLHKKCYDCISLLQLIQTDFEIYSLILIRQNKLIRQLKSKNAQVIIKNNDYHLVFNTMDQIVKKISIIKFSVSNLQTFKYNHNISQKDLRINLDEFQDQDLKKKKQRLIIYE